MTKKHYVVYFQNENAITKTSKEWAEDNQECFTKFTFNGEDKPNPDTIDKYLVSERGFTLISDSEKFVCFKLTNYMNKKNRPNNINIVNHNYVGYNNYDIEFNINNINFIIKHNATIQNTVLLYINNDVIESGDVRPELDNIAINLLILGEDFIYDDNGIHLTTHIEAKRIFDYLLNYLNHN